MKQNEQGETRSSCMNKRKSIWRKAAADQGLLLFYNCRKAIEGSSVIL